MEPLAIPDDHHHIPLNPEEEPLFRKQSSHSRHSVHPLSVDDFFDLTGLKWYHIRQLITVGLVATCEGAQIIIITLVVTLVQNDFIFSDAIKTLLATMTFVGVVIGSAIAGYFGDTFGRKKPMICAVIAMTTLNLLSAFAPNVVLFGIIRTLTGVALGFFAPLGFTYVVENVPKKIRGKIVMLANTCLFVGQLIACLLAHLTINNLSVGNWRNLLIASSAHFLIAMIASIFFLDESLRYLFAMGKMDEAFELIQKILDVNNDKNFLALSERQRMGLENYDYDLREEFDAKDIANVRALFKGELKSLTSIIWFGWFANFFVYYGVILFLPWTLEKISEMGQNAALITASSDGNADISRITLSVLLESISVVIAFFAVSIKVCSQHRVLILFFLLTGISAVAMVIPENVNIFVFFATLTKIFINICTYYYYLLTLELYPTQFRATGLGVGIAVGKLATVVVPFASYGLAEIYVKLPFALYGVFCFAASFGVTKLPLEIEYRDMK